MHYSDPTANRALSGINREFSRLEKKAKKLRTLWKEGKITEEDLNNYVYQVKHILITTAASAADGVVTLTTGSTAERVMCKSDKLVVEQGILSQTGRL